MSEIRLPSVGTIVGCYFPLDENPGSPGDKYRPVLISGVDAKKNAVAAVFGTSQTPRKRTTPVKYYEFIIAAGENKNSLSEDTLFNSSRYVWLPYEPRYFCKYTQPSIYGKIPKERVQEISSILQSGRELHKK